MRNLDPDLSSETKPRFIKTSKFNPILNLLKVKIGMPYQLAYLIQTEIIGKGPAILQETQDLRFK